MRIKEDAPTVNAGGGNIAGIGVGPQGEPGVSVKAQRRQSKNKSTPTSVILGMLRRKAPNPIAESELDDAKYGSNVTINGKNMGRMNDPNNPNKSAIDAARQSVRNAFGKNDKSDSSSNRPGAEVQRYPDKNWEESYKLAEETFAGATVFEVNSNLFYNLTLAKRKGKHWRTYLEEDDCYAEIREWARKNKGPIAVKNKNTGEIRMVRYGR